MNAVQQLLTNHIDIWTAAETEKRSGRGRAPSNAASVYGIKKLRELILELAVRGKLVPQDANDEPASELLRRIQIEKKELISRGKIKKDTLSPPITEHEKPFTLPHGWEWSRFGNALINRDAERIPVSSEDRKNRKGEFDYYGASGVIDKIDKYLFDKPLLLIGEDGANLINRSSPIAFIARGKYWVNNHAHVLDGISENFLRYIELYINAIDLKPYVTGTAQPKMNQAKMNSIILALPPENEQNRIVAKVDELMALCDQLEAQHRDAADAHEQLVSHLLQTLTQSQSAVDFNTNWQRIAVHFDTLFTTEASIDALQQTVLQLAVMGKLVAQDANDEPASELLKRIKVETDKLVSEGKIKKAKQLGTITEIEKPFNLPLGWEWSTLSSISLVNPRNSAKDDLPVSFVSMTMIDAKFNSSHDQEHRLWKEVKQGFTHFAEGDIGVAKITPCFENSKACVFSGLLNEIGAGTTELHVIRPINSTLLPRYVLAYLKSPHFLLNGESKMTGTAGQRRLPKEFVESNPFPLPPLAEQYRIIAKVDEIIEMCDYLKSRITDANQHQKKLADVFVDHAVIG